MPGPEALRERQRILDILDAHEDWIGEILVRLKNLINNGTDLREEAGLPPEQRVQGFHSEAKKRPKRPKAKRPK